MGSDSGCLVRRSGRFQVRGKKESAAWTAQRRFPDRATQTADSIRFLHPPCQLEPMEPRPSIIRSARSVA